MRAHTTRIWLASWILLLGCSCSQAQSTPQELQVEVANQTPEQAAAEARLFEALNQPVDINYFDDTLTDVLADLQNQSQVELEVDEQALFRADLGDEITFTRDLSSVSFGSAFSLLLSEHDLIWVIESDHLVVTTPPSAAKSWSTRSYRCPTLLRNRAAVDKWIETIHSNVAPDSWFADSSVPCEINPSDDRQSLLITQTLSAHRGIEDLLRQALRIQSEAVSGTAPAELQVIPLGLTPPQLAAQERIEQALTDNTELSFFDDTLSDVALFLEDMHGIPIAIDELALDDAGLDSDAPVTRTLKGITLASALDLVLSEYDLSYTIENEALLITTSDSADYGLKTRIYTSQTLRELSTQQAEELLDCITRHVTLLSWETVGGQGSIVYVKDPGVLIVTQTRDVHSQIKALLRALFEPDANENSPAENAPAAAANQELKVRLVGQTPDEETATRALEAVLAQETDCDFHQAMLATVVQFFETKHEIPIEIDATALDDAGLGTDVPISCDLSNLTLASALTLILAEYDLTYTIADEVLLITTPMEAENNLPTRLYTSEAIRNLDPQESEALVKLVIDLIEPTTWSCIGSVGDISYLPEPGVLLVSQTFPTQVRIKSLLEQLSTPLPAGTEDELHIGRVASSPAAAEREAAILAALQQPTLFEFEKETLADVVALLSSQHELLIVIDKNALDDAGLDSDLPITAKGHFDTLTAGLAEILDPYELIWRVSEEALQITTPQEAEYRTSVCIYRGGPVDELLADDPAAHLEELVTKISPESWEEVGGYGSIAYYPGCGALIVAQTQPVHDQIEEYLRELTHDAE